MKKYTNKIIKYSILGAIFSMGGLIYPSESSAEVYQECANNENEEVCLTKLKYLKKETKDFISNYEGKSKNNFIYYQASYQGLGGFSNSAGDSFFVESAGPRFSTTSYLDLQNYIEESDIGKEVEIKLEGKGMLMGDISDYNANFYFLEDSDSIQIRPYNDINVESQKGKTIKQIEDIDFVNEYSLRFPLISDNMILSPQSFLRYVEHPQNVNPNEIKDELDFSRLDNSFLYMTLKVGGELRYYGKVFEFFNGVHFGEIENEVIYNSFNLIMSGGLPFVDTEENVDSIRRNRILFDNNPQYNIYYKKGIKKNGQSTKANVLNGGITGGIVSPEVGQDLSIQDVDFGKLSIGQVIEPVKEGTMVSVRDWTGGNGWKLTAKHKEADRNKSLQLGVQVNEKAKVDLNNEANLVTEGESQLDVITQGGEYTAKWGTHPKAGEFNNVIEWNLTANITE